RPDRAGIAEAVIAVVLAAGAAALVRGARGVALGAVAFAIAAFGVGLSMTVRGGAAGDIAYHATMMPLLVFTLMLLARRREELARFLVPRECALEVVGDDGVRGTVVGGVPAAVRLGALHLGEAGRSHHARLDQARGGVAVELRPLAALAPWREALQVVRL